MKIINVADSEDTRYQFVSCRINNNDDKEKGILIFNTSDGLTPIAPIEKDASLGDILVMKEMLGGKDKDVNAVLIDNELKWVK